MAVPSNLTRLTNAPCGTHSSTVAALSTIPKDPMQEELNLLVDDMCRITVGVASAYRALKAGHRGAVVRQMCAAVRLLGASNARAGMILRETSKPLN